LLLDEHIAPAVTIGLRSACPGLEVTALRDWRGGALLCADDVILLIAAREAELSLVTFDLRTIPAVLNAWAEQGERHGGVVFVPRKTLRPADASGLVGALTSLWEHQGTADWTDRVVFLCR
jgi:hypothetical protein